MTSLKLKKSVMAINLQRKKKYSKNGITVFHHNALDLYSKWPSPTIIHSDGPYGLNSFDGDPPTVGTLTAWYEPHVKEWSKYSTPQTTLWFWNSELGWATVHPLLIEYGWKFVNCHIWNKGLSHIAGKALSNNSQV